MNAMQMNQFYDFLKEVITPFLKSNNKIYDYEIDKLGLAGPKNEHRLMWFTCDDKKIGELIVKSIYDKINVIFS